MIDLEIVADSLHDHAAPNRDRDWHVELLDPGRFERVGIFAGIKAPCAVHIKALALGEFAQTGQALKNGGVACAGVLRGDLNPLTQHLKVIAVDALCDLAS